jgi:hypothetical protein
MTTEKPEDPQTPKENDPAPLPEEWQKLRYESPQEDSSGSMMMKGCGGVVVAVLVLFGLLLGTCLLKM